MLLDTWALIEYLQASPHGKQVKEILAGVQPSIAVPTLAELVSWAHREGQDAEPYVETTRTTARVLPFTEEVSTLAGRTHFKLKKETPGFGMVDAMIYATALAYGEELVTGDPHFRGKPHVRFLE